MSLPNILSDPNSPARVFAAGAPFYLDGREALESNVFNTAAGVTLTIALRMFLLDGSIVDQVFTHTPNTAGTRDQKRFQLPEGWILNAQVFASAGTPTGTSCICVLRLVIGVTGNAQPLGVLAQGAITQSQELSWPLTIAGGGGSSSAPGLVRSITGTDPPAGSEISETVTAGKTWRLIAFHVRLVTSAAAGNRTVNLTIDDGVNKLSGSTSGNSIGPSSSTFQTTFAAYGQAISTNGAQDMALLYPNCLLGAGYRIKTVTTGLDVGDNYDPPQYEVEEF